MVNKIKWTVEDVATKLRPVFCPKKMKTLRWKGSEKKKNSEWYERSISDEDEIINQIKITIGSKKEIVILETRVILTENGKQSKSLADFEHFADLLKTGWTVIR